MPVDPLVLRRRLRNLHMYLDIDHGRLFDELGWIEDTESFAAAVDRWLIALGAAAKS